MYVGVMSLGQLIVKREKGETIALNASDIFDRFGRFHLDEWVVTEHVDALSSWRCWSR